MTASPWLLDLPDEAATMRLGEALALLLRPGDVVALSGDLGAGKSTLARALIRAFAARPSLDVPSPTFTLVQPYDDAAFRFPVLHADLYRIRDAAELDELGFDEALETGALLVEWPERAGDRLPPARITVALETAGPGRRASVAGTTPALALRVARAAAIRRFLDGTPFATARRQFLQGDASPRAYERLVAADGGTAVLLDARSRPDVPVTEARRAYMAATHLAANDDIRPILAIGAEFDRLGFSVPRPIANDVETALLLLEDLGQGFIAAAGAPVVERYGLAMDVLAALHTAALPEVAQGYGVRHRLPRYSRTALETEAALVLKHFLPAATGRPADPTVVEAFRTAWAPAFDRIDAAARTWTIFDYHSPNLMWLPERRGLAQIGILDFQDARLGPAAYDVVSLAQDARVTISDALEAGLVERYLTQRRRERGFDEADFRTLYAICGAQRATRILGVFARLAAEDGKPGYLRHIPRIAGYLDRCLRHPVLEPVRLWYDAHAPSELIEGFASDA